MSKHFRVAKGLRRRLEESGVSVSAVLQRAGLPRDFFAQERLLVNTVELFALWRAIGEVVKDPTLGVRMGNESRLERLHPSMIAALSAPTFGAAIDCMAKYKRLSAPEEILQEKDAEEWSILFRWTDSVSVEPPVLLEYCFSSLLAMARRGTGKSIAPLRVEFVQERKHVKQLERHFGCEVKCGTARNAILFRTADAELPLVTGNEELLAMLAPQFDREMKERFADESNSFLELVRSTIQRKLTGKRPTIEEIADDLHLSLRTLQRRLQDAGWNYQRLLEDARRDLAKYYLSNSVLELGEAAYLLGYEDANSFARAFRGWEGMAPRDWRETHRSLAVQ